MYASCWENQSDPEHMMQGAPGDVRGTGQQHEHFSGNIPY